MSYRDVTMASLAVEIADLEGRNEELMRQVNDMRGDIAGVKKARKGSSFYRTFGWL